MENDMIIQKPAMIVIGIECRTSNASDAGPIDIPNQWERFFKENILHQIPNKASDEVVALYCDYEGDYTQSYSFVIGCPVTTKDQIPEGMVAKVIPSGSFARYHVEGEYPQSLIAAWGKIWQTVLKRSYTGDYELYSDNFIQGKTKEMDVFVGIRN